MFVQVFVNESPYIFNLLFISSLNLVGFFWSQFPLFGKSLRSYIGFLVFLINFIICEKCQEMEKNSINQVFMFRYSHVHALLLGLASYSVLIITKLNSKR